MLNIFSLCKYIYRYDKYYTSLNDTSNILIYKMNKTIQKKNVFFS